MPNKATNKTLVDRLLQAHNRGDVAAVREILSPGLRWHHGGAPKGMGRDEYLAGFEEGRRAFSNQSITIEQAVAEGDKVAALLTVKADHTGEFQGIAATGRTIRFASLWLYRIVDRGVVEAWSIDEDVLAKLR